MKFDLGSIYVPGVGNFHVKSEYPRLKPKFERQHVENGDLEVLSANLLVWVNEYFVTTGQEEHFKELTLTVALLTVYVNPQSELYSPQMELCLKFCFWLWYIDDVIENAITNKIHFKELKRGTDQLQAILMFDADLKFEDIPNYPIFGHLFYSLSELHNLCQKNFPGYERGVKYFSDCLQRYFSAQRWLCIEDIDGRYSEETFRAYRKKMAFFDGIADSLALVHEVALSYDIWNSTTMKRLLDIANVFGAFVNDLLGMRKEFANGQKDSLIVFKVVEKKIPLDVATQQVCELLATELSDYVLLKGVILKEFDYDDNLIRYLDILDSIIDGHNVIYARSARHRSVGSISLTR